MPKNKKEVVKEAVSYTHLLRAGLRGGAGGVTDTRAADVQGGLESVWRQLPAVSYTHLDVYKRQDDGSDKDAWTKKNFEGVIYALEHSNPGFHWD